MQYSNSTSSNLVLTLQNPAFCSYIIVVSLLVLKMMAVAALTVRHRFRTLVFISPEDAKWRDGQVGLDDTVERIRRAHRNDVENIPMFIIMALMYLWTEPALWLAHLLYFAYLAVRVLHTFVYAVIVVPQPTRATLWVIGMLITGYMACHIAIVALINLF